MVWNNTELLYFSSRSQKSKVGQQVAFWGFQGRTCFLVSSSFQRPPAFLDLQPLPLSSHHSKLCLLLLLSLFSRVRLCATLWTVAHQAPLCVGFSRQEYWRGLPCSSASNHFSIIQLRPSQCWNPLRILLAGSLWSCRFSTWHWHSKSKCLKEGHAFLTSSFYQSSLPSWASQATVSF